MPITQENKRAAVGALVGSFIGSLGMAFMRFEGVSDTRAVITCLVFAVLSAVLVELSMKGN